MFQYEVKAEDGPYGEEYPPFRMLASARPHGEIISEVQRRFGHDAFVDRYHRV